MSYQGKGTLLRRVSRILKRDERVAWPFSYSRNAHDQNVLAWDKSASRRARGWAGENVARNRESTRLPSEAKRGIGKARSWDHLGHHLVRAVRGRSLRPCSGQDASLGEEAVLADSGRAGEVAAGAGWVTRLAFLSNLPGCCAKTNGSGKSLCAREIFHSLLVNRAGRRFRAAESDR